MGISVRTLLFKMPTAERPQYAQKLLDILGSPSNMIIKLTTYRSRWIPSEVYENPKCLEKKPAWIICVDAKRTGTKYIVQKFIPVREVEIAKAVRDGDNLVLWLETRDYLSCDDYEKFHEELEGKIPRLPPNEKSYIACDVSISAVKIAESVEINKVNEAWKRIVDALGSMDVYNNTIFYRVIGISKGSSYLKTEEGGNGKPQKFYRLTVNETYKLQIYYSLPERQFEHCPQYIKISANEWVRIYGECKIDDRVGSLDVLMKPLQTSDEYPYKNTIGLNTSIESSQLSGPLLRFPVIFMKERWCTRLRRNLRTIVYSILCLMLFFVGQILPDIYETIYGIPSTTIGAILSTLAITLMPLVFANLFRKGI